MRLDKYLKVSRIVKRRVLAKELCDGGRAMINGRPAKAGSEVQAGDILELHFGPRVFKAEVLDVKEHVPAAEAASLYRLV